MLTSNLQIMANFGLSKTDLNLKYRLGLEHALAKADFLSVPDLVLVQAFTIFLTLVRRHDSPRFVWMMTGLVIRMAQALGLQRDGANFAHLTPYEIEMRRRIWWMLCTLDIRASEDQGTDYTIASDSFDTKFPLNINDADIEPGTTEMPTARDCLTDMTIPLVQVEICNIVRKMMAQSSKDDAPGIEEQNRLINEIYQKVDQGYLQYSVEEGNIVYWLQVTVTRLVMAKMTLFIYLPVLFSSPSAHFSDQIKNKLLVAAIEVAEYNHALNAEQACKNWRWVYQTYTHWHAIVYILIEICRRPWSPIAERAWVALRSPWLIPAQSNMRKNLRVWVPLRKLTAKAKKHRDAELERLRSDPQAAERLEMEDQRIPVPGSSGPFPAGFNSVEVFREQWHKLLEGPGHDKQTPGNFRSEITSPSVHSTYTAQPNTSSIPTYSASDVGSNATFEPTYLSQNVPSNTSPNLQSNTPGNFAIGQAAEPLYNTDPRDPASWSTGPGLTGWLWADADPSANVFANVDVDAIDVNMDLDGGDIDWYNWVESAKGMEWDTGIGRT